MQAVDIKMRGRQTHACFLKGRADSRKCYLRCIVILAQMAQEDAAQQAGGSHCREITRGIGIVEVTYGR